MTFIPKKRGFDEVVKIISVESKWIIKIGLWTLGMVKIGFDPFIQKSCKLRVFIIFYFFPQRNMVFFYVGLINGPFDFGQILVDLKNIFY